MNGGRYYCEKCRTGLIHEYCPSCGCFSRKIPTPFVHYDSAERPKKAKKAKKAKKSARRLIPLLARREGWVCHLCGEEIDPDLEDGPRRATLDHLLPRSKGGTNEQRNLKLAHYECNMKRGNRLLAEMAE